MSRSLYLIDGHYHIFRAYYAPFSPLTSPTTGEPTKAIHAFCATLFNLIRTRRPDYLVMVLDVGDETTFRRAFYPPYKAHREPPPEDFGPQADRIVSIVQAMDIPILRAPGFEADDVMATIATRMAEQDHDLDVYLVSRDKDLDQLLTDRIKTYDPSKDEITDATSLVEKKGFTPEQAVEIQTLTGDNVDNVPGIFGVGPKTALKLIAQYGTAEAVLKNAHALTPKLRDSAKAFAGEIDITRRLVTLRRDVPIELDMQAARFESIPLDRVKPIFVELGFNRLTDQLETFRPAGQAPPAPPQPGLFREPSSNADYQLVDTVAKLDRLAGALAKTPIFAFDTETTSLSPAGGDLVGISLSWKEGEGWYIPVRAAVGATLPVEVVVRALKPVFADERIKKCGQNLKFDMVVLRQVGIETAGAEFDTLIASYVLEPLRSSHGLDALARDICGHIMIPISDLIGKGKNQITMDQVDSARVCEYAAEDADFTWRLYEHFKPRIADSPMRRVFEYVEMPLVEVLAEMENNGIALDKSVLARMSVTMADRLEELTGEIHTAAGHKFNIDSTKQLANVLFEEQGLESLRKTKTGVSTDADTLEALADMTTCAIPRLVLEYRELTKLKGTYIDTLPDMINPRTGRIHSSFHQTGAITGRLSSSNPNLQNIPVRTETGRQIRTAFVASHPDNVLLTADYSQIELRVLAHFCGDSALQVAFAEGQDIHAFVAAQIHGVDVSQVTKDQRNSAKAVNFGIIYGQTAFGLSRALGIPGAEAKSFIDTYFMRYPGIRLFIDKCIHDATKLGYAETIMGRRRPIEELQSRNRQTVSLGERLAVNTVVQGSAADLIKRAMIDIHAAIKSQRRPSRMLLQVHDELVFELPRSAVDSESAMIREKMACAIPLDVPIVVDVNWGRNWLEGK